MTRDPLVTSRIMRAIKNRNTGPELVLRHELHRRGLRYRLRSKLTGQPDLVFPRSRVVVFVDGDYWHGNTWRLRGATSFEAYCAGRANSEFWRAKIAGNVRRDAEVTRTLKQRGWTVVRIWESDIVKDLMAAAGRVETVVRADGDRVNRDANAA